MAEERGWITLIGGLLNRRLCSHPTLFGLFVLVLVVLICSSGESVVAVGHFTAMLVVVVIVIVVGVFPSDVLPVSESVRVGTGVSISIRVGVFFSSTDV